MHADSISRESVRACIGALQEKINNGKEGDVEPCFTYLRTVSDHFHSETEQGGGA
jgi:hypothetical protein